MRKRPFTTAARARWTAVAAAIVACCAALASTYDPDAREPHASLRKYFQLDEKDLQALDNGRVVARVETPDERDVLLVGAVRLRASSAQLMAGFRDVQAFRQSDMLMSVGRVDQVPTPEDFASLTLEPGEVRSLDDCRPGACDFKLGAADIQRFRTEVDWGSARAHAQAEAVMRGILARAARTYVDRGDAGLEELRDHTEPVNRRAAFLAIVRRLPYLQASAPGMVPRITDPPFALGTKTDEFLYWSKANLGLKPVISLTHVAMCQAGGSNDVVIASRQIVANHHLDASLGLTVLVGSRDGSGLSYLLYINRSRIDRFPGPFGAVVRALMKSRIRSGLEKSLVLARARLEGPSRPGR